MAKTYTNNTQYRQPYRRYARRRSRAPKIFIILLLSAALLLLGFYLIKGRGLSGRLGRGTLPGGQEPPDAVQFGIDYESLEQKCESSQGGFQATEGELSALRELAEENPEYRKEIEFLTEHIDAYSQDAVNAVLVSPEKAAFVLLEPFEERTYGEVELSADELDGGVPFLLQYDSRWAFHPYGSSVMGYTACGPTCLSMAAIGVTGDGKYDPVYVSDFAEKAGYYVWGTGTSWLLFTEGAAALGLTGTIIPADENGMRARLDAGEVLIASMTEGDFTMNGHFIVIYDYTSSGFCVYDPSSVEKSELTWTFSRLQGQMAQLWSISE